MFIRRSEQNPRFFIWHSPQTYQVSKNRQLIKKPAGVLYCNRHESARRITLKNCARYFEWIPNGEKMSINFHNKSVFVPMIFSRVKTDIVSMRKSWIISLSSIIYVLFSHVCVIFFKIAQKWLNRSYVCHIMIWFYITFIHWTMLLANFAFIVRWGNVYQVGSEYHI